MAQARGVGIALVAALALVATALALVLSGSPPTVVRSSMPLAELTELRTIGAPARLCQAGEVLPAETTAVRLSLETLIGPPVSLTASAGGRLLTSGRRAAGWSSGSVTIPVARVAHTRAHVTVCVRIAGLREPLNEDGVPTPPARAARLADGQATEGRMFVEYLRPGTSSWWSLARAAVRRMGLGHAFGGGSWVALLAAGAMAAVAAIGSWLVLRELA